MNHPNPHFLAHEMVVVVVSHQQKHCCNVVVVLVVVVMVLLLTGQHHPCPCRRVVHSVRDGDDHDAVPVPAFHERYDCRNQSIMHVATLHKHRWNDHPMQCTPMPNEHDPWPNDHSTLHTIKRERERHEKRDVSVSSLRQKPTQPKHVKHKNNICVDRERERERHTRYSTQTHLFGFFNGSRSHGSSTDFETTRHNVGKNDLLLIPRWRRCEFGAQGCTVRCQRLCVLLSFKMILSLILVSHP